MTPEVEEVMKLFNITEENAVIMLEKGFKLSNFNSSIESYVNNRIEGFTDTYKNTIRDIISKELNQD